MNVLLERTPFFSEVCSGSGVGGYRANLAGMLV